MTDFPTEKALTPEAQELLVELLKNAGPIFRTEEDQMAELRPLFKRAYELAGDMQIIDSGALLDAWKEIYEN